MKWGNVFETFFNLFIHLNEICTFYLSSYCEHDTWRIKTFDKKFLFCFYFRIKINLYCIYREEREKLNVWVALLNLENSYGTKDSLETLFQEAIKANEPKKIYMKMVELYIKNDKNEVSYLIWITVLLYSHRIW